MPCRHQRACLSGPPRRMLSADAQSSLVRLQLLLGHLPGVAARRTACTHTAACAATAGVVA
eukprot:12226535-Alexandrium_andersonii.AAC.1